MKEQFVTYEIAVKLKEKGFVEPCIGWWYNPTGNDADLFLVEYGEAEDNNSVMLNPNSKKMADVGNWKQICEERKHSCSAPLWQQAFDWILQKLEETNSEQYNRRWSYIICSDNTGAWDYGNGDAYYNFSSKETGILLGLNLL